MRCVELVVTDIGETEVVGEVGIEQVVSYAATEAQTAIKMLEHVLRERMNSITIGKILRLSANAQREVATGKWLHRKVLVYLYAVFHNDREF